MRFACPKCGFIQQVRTSNRQIRPFPTICGSCSTRYLVVWKIRLADSTIICSWCGGKQADASRCLCCGHDFTDYSPAPCEQREPAPSKATTGPAKAKADRPKAKAGGSRAGARSSSYASALAKLRVIPLRFGIFAVCLALLPLLTLLGGGSLARKHTERLYLSNYVTALYGIKSGMDLCGRTYGDLIADCKKDGKSGLSVGRELSGEDRDDMATVKGEVDKVMLKLHHPPEKYAELSVKLQGMHRGYLAFNDLSNAPFGQLAVFESKVKRANDDFSKAIADLKSNMPGALAEELRRAEAKYKLDFVIEKK